MKKALVIGGSGMLRGLSEWLAKDHITCVMGRDKAKLERIAAQSKNIFPLALDYANNRDLKEALRSIEGNIDITVAWIHSYAKNAFDIVIDDLGKRPGENPLFHIVGSNSLTPDPFIKYSLYHSVRLGHIVENGKSRWLSDREICAGVTTAIQTRSKNFTIGVTESETGMPEH